MQIPGNVRVEFENQAAQEKPLVLVVESDALQRDLISLAVQRSHMQCVTVRGMNEVRQALEQRIPSILLVDLYLDGENGLDLIIELKKSKRGGSIKVIAFSSYGYPEVIHQAIQAGVADFLVKPLDMEVLIERIQQALRKG